MGTKVYGSEFIKLNASMPPQTTASILFNMIVSSNKMRDTLESLGLMGEITDTINSEHEKLAFKLMLSMEKL